MGSNPTPRAPDPNFSIHMDGEPLGPTPPSQLIRFSLHKIPFSIAKFLILLQKNLFPLQNSLFPLQNSIFSPQNSFFLWKFLILLQNSLFPLQNSFFLIPKFLFLLQNSLFPLQNSLFLCKIPYPLQNPLFPLQISRKTSLRGRALKKFPFFFPKLIVMESFSKLGGSSREKFPIASSWHTWNCR